MSEDLTKKLPSSDGEKLTQILSTVQRLDSAVERLDSRLISVEQRVEERLYDTRPIWEKVNLDIAELHAGQLRLTEGQQRLEVGQLRLTEGHQQLEAGQLRLTEGHQRLEEGQLHLTEGQRRLQEGQEFLRGESRENRTLLRDIFRRLSIFNDTLVTMQADYRDIYDRVREIERQR